MTAVLASDALISVLAGLSLLFLRRSLASVDLMLWLRTSLRFGCLVLAAFYVLRPATWIWDSTFIDRVLLIAAALAPLAVLLISEAAVRRHAPASLKWACLIGTVIFVLGALVFPRSLTTLYLGGLLAFQVVILLASAAMLWWRSAGFDPADRKLVRTFAGLVLVSLPVIVLESAVLSDGAGLHLSALVLLIGVWLLFTRSLWVADMTRLGAWGGSMLVLATVTGWALSVGQSGLSVFTLAAPLLAVLIFASLVALQLARTSSDIEQRLLDLLGQTAGDTSRLRVLEALSDRNATSIPMGFMAATDAPTIAERLNARPVWTTAERGLPEDADQALADIALRANATHLVALGPQPSDLVGLQLGPSDTSARLIPLLTALARRFDGGSDDGR